MTEGNASSVGCELVVRAAAAFSRAPTLSGSPEGLPLDRQVRWVLDYALVEHRVGDFDEAGEVRAVDVGYEVAFLAVLDALDFGDTQPAGPTRGRLPGIRLAADGPNLPDEHQTWPVRAAEDGLPVGVG